MCIEGRLARSGIKMRRSEFVRLLIIIYRHGDSSAVVIKLATQNKWKVSFTVDNIPAT